MKPRIATILTVLTVPTVLTVHPASAQAVSALQPLYEMVKGYVLKSAEQMPEANYAFKPTPEVRSFGELIGHIAGANFLFCATAKGVKSPSAEDAFEKVTAKADLVKALKDAFAYCDPVFKMPDASFTESAEMYGMKMTRLGWLMLNVTHDNEHYGNIVTYFRLKGMVPPSSQPRTTM
jgi:uncharacterized damage-inducible protein DinB